MDENENYLQDENGIKPIQKKQLFTIKKTLFLNTKMLNKYFKPIIPCGRERQKILGRIYSLDLASASAFFFFCP